MFALMEIKLSRNRGEGPSTIDGWTFEL
eukprot:SAG31_NODE_23445_length_504_cov_0.896296_1_plen_27_part_10